MRALNVKLPVAPAAIATALSGRVSARLVPMRATEIAPFGCTCAEKLPKL